MGTNSNLDKKAMELLSKMTLEEKLGQIQCMQIGREPLEESMKKFANGVGEVALFGGKPTPAENAAFAEELQERAKQYSELPPILHGEAVTGFNSGEATIFPSAIGLGATWDPDLVQEMADTIRKQMLSVGTRHALSPVMDVARDPRWGRVGETYGEDPTLCARMSVAFVKGLQSEDLANGIAACGKHFLGYGNGEGGLNMAANPIPARELREVYAKPFQAAITEGGLASIMNSYGSIDGELVIQSEEILNHLLREEMDFEGIVVSDYMSIDKAVDLKMAPSAAEGGKRALEAGLDIELPTPFGYTEDIAEAVRSGKIPEALLDRAVLRVIKTKLRMGLLENASPRKDLIEEAYDRKSTRKVSLKAAREATVLLKNDGILPLSKSNRKIALIGPHGNSLRLLFGCYTFPATLDMILSGSMHDMAGMENVADKDGTNAPKDGYYPGSTTRRESPQVTGVLQKLYGEKTPTILASLTAKCPEADIQWEDGCDIIGNDTSRFAQAADLAKRSDVAILCLGGKYGWGSNCTVGEGVDTDKIGLPGVQEELVKAICKTGTPVILVHMDAKPLSSVYSMEHCAAVLEYWFPGDTGGEALADILFGDYNPAGRLPMTAARTEGQIPIYYSHRRGSGYSKTLGMTLCKYVEGDKKPISCFGSGISYTSFAYSNLQVTPAVGSEGTVRVSCDITNTGSRDGEEVVQLYVTDALASMLQPNQELAGFARVHIKKGQTRRVVFAMKASQFAFLDRKMQWTVEAGEMLVHVGASSDDIRLEGKFEITDTSVVKGSTRGFYAAAEVSDL